MAPQNEAQVEPAAPAKGNGRRAALAHRDPFELLAALEDELARVWRSPLRLGPVTLGRPPHRVATSANPWTPRLDVFEKGGTLVVKAELPGVKREDLQVALDGTDLIIRGERQEEREVEEADYHRSERSYGSFYRRLALPFEVAAEQITAAFSDGVLEVTVPQPVQEPSKALPITVK